MPDAEKNTTSQPVQSSPPPKPAAVPSQPQPPKKKSKGAKIVLSIAGGCLIVVLIGTILGYYVYKQVKNRAEEKLEGISFEELEKSLANLPSTEELDKIAQDMEKNTTESAKKSGAIGEELSDGEVSITVNSLKRQDKIKDNAPTDNYEYVIVNVTLKNEAVKEISVFTSNFFLRDSDANQYYGTSLAEDSLEQPIAAWQYLSAEQSTTGNIVFEAKKDVGDLDVVYDGKETLEFKTAS